MCNALQCFLRSVLCAGRIPSVCNLARFLHLAESPLMAVYCPQEHRSIMEPFLASGPWDAAVICLPCEIVFYKHRVQPAPSSACMLSVLLLRRYGYVKWCLSRFFCWEIWKFPGEFIKREVSVLILALSFCPTFSWFKKKRNNSNCFQL